MRGLFVTGTGTGVGKTVLSAALLAAMSAAGVRVRAHKPIVTGLDEPAGEWPPDHELLARVAGMRPEEVAPLRYGPAVSPHLAARLAGETIDPDGVLARARSGARAAVVAGALVAAGTPTPMESPAATGKGAAAGTLAATGTPTAAGTEMPSVEETLIVEGVGGLLVPLADDFTVRDLAAALGLPVLIAAAPGLGTINHTLLTLEAARGAGLDVRAVVLTPWPDAPAELERSNRDTIARLGDVEIATLSHVHSPTPADLTRAGAALPWRHWCPPESFVPRRP